MTETTIWTPCPARRERCAVDGVECECERIEEERLRSSEPEIFLDDVCPTCKGGGTVNPLTAPSGLLCLTTTTCPTCEGSGDAIF